MEKRGFPAFQRLAFATLLTVLPIAPEATAGLPSDDTDAEKFDSFGGAVARGDFNGDTFEDLAVGVPGETVEGMVGAGSVEVIYGTSEGLGKTRQFFRQGAGGVDGEPDPGDGFGNALAAGDFNADGYDDLAIGAPGESLGLGADRAGTVHVLHGSASGIVGPDLLLNLEDVSGWYPATDDHFGASLATGDLNGDGFDDLAIGVTATFGWVNVIMGSQSGLPRFWGSTVFCADAQGVDDPRHCGKSVTIADFNGDGVDDLAIGDSGDVPGSPWAGTVTTVHGDEQFPTRSGSLRFFHQDQSFTEGRAGAYEEFGYSLASGDFNRDGFADLAVGVPAETNDVGGVSAAGAVNVLYAWTSGLDSKDGPPDQLWHQDTANVSDVAEALDLFGASLSVGDFNGDGFDDLAIGVPLEDLGGVGDAGAVNVIYGSRAGLNAVAVPNQLWHQDVPDVEDAAGAGDGFGWAVSAGDFNGDGLDDLATGVPWEDLQAGGGPIYDAGAVNVIYGASLGLSANFVPDQFWTQAFLSPPLP